MNNYLSAIRYFFMSQTVSWNATRNAAVTANRSQVHLVAQQALSGFAVPLKVKQHSHYSIQTLEPLLRCK